MDEPEKKKKNVLITLAAEGIVPVVGGCAGAAAGGAMGGIAGVAVGRAVEKAVNVFGKGIVDRWQYWLSHNPEAAEKAIVELAATLPEEARSAAKEILLELAPEVDDEDLEFALEYISAIPNTVDRALIPGKPAGQKSMPPTVGFEDARSLLQLLPQDVAPYRAGTALPNSPYQLLELVGSGGFGSVFRAISPTLQHLPLAIKFCLDRTLLPALNQERSNLERLLRAGGKGSANVVKLYGYDLDHQTPYLVYEFVEGGDLGKLISSRRIAKGTFIGANEALGWIVQIATGLAFAHRAGIVHRDLKPANILVVEKDDDDLPPENSITPVYLKLADFGLGGVAAARASAQSRIGASTVDYLSLADQASLFRGAGTPLYMSPEQRRGAAPDPRHDLYALGVVWYQILVGDVSRELHHGWAKELRKRFNIPTEHIELIERCVGWFDERPKDAIELLPLLQDVSKSRATDEKPNEAPPPPAEPVTDPVPAADTLLSATQTTLIKVPTSESRQRSIQAGLSRLRRAYLELDRVTEFKLIYTTMIGFAIGLISGWLVGEFSYGIRIGGKFPNILNGWYFDWLSVVIGFCSGLTIWLIYVVLVRAVRVQSMTVATEKIEQTLNEIAADFPQELADLGGRSILRDLDSVQQILREIRSTSSKYTFSSNDPTYQLLLVARLRDMKSKLENRKNTVEASWIGFFFIAMVAVPLACYGTHHLLEEFSDTLANCVAVVLSFGTVLSLWWSRLIVQRSNEKYFKETCDEFVADYPEQIKSWGGKMVLTNNDTLDALIKLLDAETK